MRRKLALVLSIMMVFAAVFSGFAAPVFADAHEYGEDRIALPGGDRYSTAAEIAERAYPEGADTVIIVRGDHLDGDPQVVDALSASGLAGVMNAPVLLVNQQLDEVPDATATAIEELGATEAYIIGGPGAVNEDIEADLATMITGEPVRVSGDADTFREGTAAAVAEMVLEENDSTTAIITSRNNANLVDSLTAGPVAHEMGYPILLVTYDGVPAVTQSFIEDNGIENLYIIGGAGGAVSGDVQSELEALVDGDVTRVAGIQGETGADRVGTAIEVADYFFEDSEGAALVNGWSYVDAVPASVLGMPVLYVNQDNLLNENVTRTRTVEDVLETKTMVRAIGGLGVIADSVLEAAKAALSQELAVVSVSATNSRTVEVVMNQDVEGVVAGNFNIYEEGNEFAIQFIEDIDVDEEVVTINLLEPGLEDEETYVLTIDGVEGEFEFTYEAGTPTTLEFVSTTVVVNSELEYVLYDENGNDITIDYPDNAFTLQTSNANVIDTNFQAGSTVGGYAVVNAFFMEGEDEELSTGNTNITLVAEAPDVLTSLGAWTLEEGTFAEPKTSMFLTADGNPELMIQALDEDGAVINSGLETTYRSTTPTIAQIDTDGKITAIRTGTASFVVTVEQGDVRLSRTVNVVINADPVATSLEVTTTQSDLVAKSGIEKEVTVTLLDQYGDKFIGETDPVEFTFTNNNERDVVDSVTAAEVVEGEVNTGVYTLDVTSGEATFDILPGEQTGTADFEFELGTLEASLRVTSVEAAAFSSYVAVPSATTLDIIDSEHEDYTELNQGPETSNIVVYARDINGNYIEKVADEDITLAVVGGTSNVITVNNTTNTVAAVAAGSRDVSVTVEGLRIATIGFTVVDSTPSLSRVAQVQSSLVYDVTDLEAQLFGTFDGTTWTNGAFLGYDQYGSRIMIEDFEAWTSHPNIITPGTQDTANVLDVAQQENSTNVSVTLKIADEYFVITVRVPGTN